MSRYSIKKTHPFWEMSCDLVWFILDRGMKYHAEDSFFTCFCKIVKAKALIVKG